jgi:hypothetical protein
MKDWEKVLKAAAGLQKIVPGAVLVVERLGPSIRRTGIL